ncbi:hypothetical protein KL920_002876 [Ogataea angusta]|uniref:Uncharacterized protein n=1 Tax=Pichia angusta TaxID=870730 RepID=A0AAN6DDT5_PICAN|nr:uncharacterized protein KL928_003176 [Ogataea angusta]KAG7818175.1 hypothetical protein KL928_003176 [Ogataea angusta]KAG7829083.1 hypothetical protein KL920_002876 [Ogataea angusta]KAG7858649.1 hypothetical protein KL939_002771 [Ogataea angusta]
MTVAVESPYPTPRKELGHAVNYLSGNHDYDVPQETLDLEVAALRAKLEAKPTFDPRLRFDPARHLVFKPEYYKTTQQFTLSDLNIKKTRVKPVTDFAAAFPFPLISQEAVDMLLWEALQPEVLRDYARVPNLSKGANRLDFHVGGHCSKKAPFSNALFTAPELREILEGFTRTKVEPVYNAEYGHLNVSLASLKPEDAAQFAASREEQLKVYEAQTKAGGNDVPSTLGLHYDSSAFALVIMLDFGDSAIGGETGIITGHNEMVRVPDPKVGWATLIQGMVLRHVATKPVTNSNRITSVGGFCLAGPEHLDNNLLTSTKPSVLPRALYNEFYRDWCEFRLNNLQRHIGYYKEQLMAEFDSGKTFDQLAFAKKCQEMERYLRKSWDEMEAVYNPPYPPAQFSTPYEELPDYED